MKTWDDIIAYEDMKANVATYVAKKQDGYELLTIRQLARRFKMRQQDMLQLVEDTDDLDYNIGVQIPGRGRFVERYIGDYTVETN